MQLLRSQKTTAWLRKKIDKPSDSDEHRPAQNSKRQKFNPVPTSKPTICSWPIRF